MKNIIVVLFFSIYFIGCMPPPYQSILSPQLNSKIPNGADKVVLSSALPTDSLFNEVFSVLTEQNFRISSENKSIGYLSTEGKDIGSGTYMRMSIKITKTENGSKLVGSAEWMPDAVTLATANAIFGAHLTQEWGIASRSNVGKPDFVFEKMVLILQRITNININSIEFIKDL